MGEERRVCSSNESAFHNLYVRIENRGEKRSVSETAAAVVPAYGDFLKMCVCVVVGFWHAMASGAQERTHIEAADREAF